MLLYPCVTQYERRKPEREKGRIESAKEKKPGLEYTRFPNLCIVLRVG